MHKRRSFTAAVFAVAAILLFGGPALAGRPGTGTISEAALTGAQVVPGPGGPDATGDPDGTGAARFIFYPNKHKICYTIQVSDNARATSAHLHEAPAGQNGPVKLKLDPPPMNDTSDHGCIRGLGERFIKRISGNPSGYYVDVHNAEYPGGAVQGQLTRVGPR